MRSSRSTGGRQWLGAWGLLLGMAIFALMVVLPPSASSRAAEDDLLALRPAADHPLATIGLRHPSEGHPGPGETGPLSSAGSVCDKDIDTTGSIAGVSFIAAQDNSICTNADIDVYTNGGEQYVVQAGGQEAAFTITRIAADGTPTQVQQSSWVQTNTYTPDVKAFKQGTKRYIALALERLAVGDSACGVVIVDVTDAPTLTVEAQVTGSDWCDVHNVFVEDDANGDGRYIYLTADLPNDMRVLDIGNLNTVTETGRYTHPDAGSGIYVHDVTVIDHGGAVGRRVYVSYWDAGLMILDAADVTPGVIEAGSPNQPLNPEYSINPAGFRTHHAYPSEDGTRVFIQDEFLNSAGAEPVQMWDIGSPAAPAYVDGIALGSALMPVVNPAHNLLVEGNRLYVGWYKAGLQAFDFDSAGFLARPIHHQVQTETADGAYDGAWGVRLATIGTTAYVLQSDRAYGLIVDATLESVDSDGDGVPDGSDNCLTTPNPSQTDADGDTIGDACDTETGVTGIGDCGDGLDNDGDTFVDGADSGCLPDTDGDGVPDGSDNCPTVSSTDLTNSDADNEAAGFRLGTGSPLPILAGDADGNPCDSDDDNDSFTDTDEQRIYDVSGFASQQEVPCSSPAGSDPWPAP